MPVVRVSSKYQVVIPQEVREFLRIKPGMKVQVLLYEGRIELVPVRPMREMKGYLRRMDTSVPRDDERV